MKKLLYIVIPTLLYDFQASQPPIPPCPPLVIRQFDTLYRSIHNLFPLLHRNSQTTCSSNDIHSCFLLLASSRRIYTDKWNTIHTQVESENLLKQISDLEKDFIRNVGIITTEITRLKSILSPFPFT